MSEMLDIPIPSATSRMSSTSFGSNSGETGRPRITASGALRLSSLQPSAPPSLKSTKVTAPDADESAENLLMLKAISSSGASLRYLCLSPSGGATSSWSDMPP